MIANLVSFCARMARAWDLYQDRKLKYSWSVAWDKAAR